MVVTMPEMLPLNEVTTHLSEIVSRVGGGHERVTVTVDGRPTAVIISPDDLEALHETIAVLSDPDALRQLALADAELARGEGETETDLVEAMRRRRTSV
jgi:antitoxin YefM